jgi:hypothetical protein
VVRVEVGTDDRINARGSHAGHAQRQQQLASTGPAEIAFAHPAINEDRPTFALDQEAADRSVDRTARRQPITPLGPVDAVVVIAR